MHEEVLSAATLEKAFKETFNLSGSSDSISKNANIVLRAFGAPLCHCDLRAAVSIKPTARPCDSRRSSCYCINPLFVSSLTHPAPGVRFSLLSGGKGTAHVGDLPQPSCCTLECSSWWESTLLLHLGRCYVLLCDWRQNVSPLTLVSFQRC